MANPAGNKTALRVAHVVPRVHEEASGIAYAVTRLCRGLSERQVDLRLYVTRTNPLVDFGFPIEIHPAWRILPGLGISPRMRVAIAQAAQNVDVLHNHGLWMMSNVYCGAGARHAPCKLLVSPHGTLSPYAMSRSSLKKKIFLALGQRTVLDRADCFHATAESECEDLRRLGLRSPIAVIPNGVDICQEMPERPRQRGQSRFTLLFLARLHPIKGVELLLQAWSRLQGMFRDWDLRLVGPGDTNYLARLETLCHGLGCERVSFDGPAYGDAKRDVYAKSDLFVLPTHTENFGVSVAEALGAGIPAIVTRGAPWAGLQTRQCGWWIDRSADSLEAALRAGMSLSPEQRAEMGVKGRRWIQNDFSWEMVAERVEQTYSWLVGRGDKPAWVLS